MCAPQSMQTFFEAMLKELLSRRSTRNPLHTRLSPRRLPHQQVVQRDHAHVPRVDNVGLVSQRRRLVLAIALVRTIDSFQTGSGQTGSSQKCHNSP